MEILLLGEDGRPVPLGATGEIAVRSAYLAAGYWRSPELTAARFRTDPARPGSRIYRTGDLGRLRPDDMLEHLGRADGVAKVRGARVEIADVESALAMLPGVAEAAAAVREDGGAAPRLVAYLVPVDGSFTSVSEIRRALAERLPDFMVPSAIVMLERFPLSDNGKVDRGALPPPGPERPALGVTFVAPRGALESRLAEAWAETLGVTPIGIHDNFLDLGGDSLKAAAALARVASEIGIELSLEELFDAPTVAGLTERIERRLGPPPPGAPPR